MKEFLVKLEGLQRDPKYAYFCKKGANGNVEVKRVAWAKSKADKGKKEQELVIALEIPFEKHYLYYIGENPDDNEQWVGRAQMQFKGKTAKPKK